jgi:glycosyltransferase involved in cell wall biosynthesis
MSHLQHQMPFSAAFLGRSAVVIPALNEESCVADVVRGWLEQGAALVRVVDNGSSDNTAIQAAKAGADVFREPRRGYGAAAWRGTHDLPVGIEWIIFSSADGSDRLDAAEAAAFQAAFDNGADLVVGERVSSPESRRSRVRHETASDPVTSDQRTQA